MNSMNKCIIQVQPDEIKDIFKKEKTNLPKSQPPQPLMTYLGAVHSDILGSCKKPKNTMQ